MAISLKKGQQASIGLQRVCIGLGWDPNKGTGYDFDLDASAFMLGADGQIPEQEYFVFYGNQTSPDGAVEAGPDDTDAKNSDGGDNETIIVDLNKVSPIIKEILCVATIYEFDVRKQNFGQVANSYIRICNEQTGEELVHYDLDEDFSTETGVIFGRLYRQGSEWKFGAIGEGVQGGLQALVDKYARRFS